MSVCHCLDQKISLREMNELYPHCGLIGYGDSYLDSLLRYAKVFCLHAILHDAAGAVYTEKRKGPGYCYMIGRGPKLLFVWSYHRTSFLSLFEVFCTFHIQPIQLLNKIP